MGRRRDRGTAAERGYGPDWQALRERHLEQNPLCAPCERAGLATAATTVDHVIPFRGIDDPLRLDDTNLESQCSTCHFGDKQRVQKGGEAYYRGCDASGQPLDPGHHWRA